VIRMERPTVDLANDRSRMVRLAKPGVDNAGERPSRSAAEVSVKLIDKARNNGGAYSVTTKKPRATTEAGTGVARVAATSPAGCDLLEASDGNLLVRIQGAVVKLSEADARALVELLTSALP